jgi:hypothetical protein
VAPGTLSDSVQQAPDSSFALLDSPLPLLVLAGLLVGALGAGRLLKSEANVSVLSNVGVTFDDVPDYVPGNSEAKEELETVVAFLKNPEVFQKLGANVPKRVLISGLGDTEQMAQAVAGESGVPFLRIVSGDSAVRDVFTEAREQTPCVLFIPFERQREDAELEAELATERPLGNHTEPLMSEDRLNEVLQEMTESSSSELVVVAGSSRQDVPEELSRFFELRVVVEPEPDGVPALALATYVSQNDPPGRPSSGSGKTAPWRDVKVLELGSGTSMAGIAAASVGADVLLTDRSRLLPLMSKNIRLNQEQMNVGSAACAAFEWAQVEKPGKEVSKESWDVVLGANLACDLADVPFLADTLAFLLGPLGAAKGGIAIYAHRPRSVALDESLQSAFKERGLSCRVLPSLSPQASGEASPWNPTGAGNGAAGLDEVFFWELQSSSVATPELAAQVLIGQRDKAGGLDQVPAEFFKELSQKSKRT